MIKKMFKTDLTKNEQHIIREQLPLLLACDEDPYPFEPIAQFFNYFEEESPQQNLDSGFAIHNTCKEFDMYIKKPQMIMQLKNKTLLGNTNEDLFLDAYKEMCRQDEKEESKYWTSFKDAFAKKFFTEKRYPVKYLMVDRSATKLYKKIEMIREWQDEILNENDEIKKLDYLSKPKPVLNAKIKRINFFMKEINNKFSSKISNHIVLQKIMDANFDNTQRVMLTFCLINFLGGTLPFIFQIFLFRENFLEGDL